MSDICGRRRVSKTRGTDAKGRRLPASYKWSSQLPGWRERDGKKDQVVTFEELGVDHLYVDEAHSYKNAFLYTKMRNVAGIAQNEAQKSADMFNKCQYLDEITGGKGIMITQ